MRLCRSGLHDMALPRAVISRGRCRECERSRASIYNAAHRAVPSGLCRKRLHDITLPGTITVDGEGHRRCLLCRRASGNASGRRANQKPERKAYIKVYMPKWWAAHPFERELYNVTQLAKTRGQ